MKNAFFENACLVFSAVNFSVNRGLLFGVTLKKQHRQ